MRRFLTTAVVLALPTTAFAHTAIVDHAHPHGAAHPYVGLETILAFAAGAAVVGIVAYGLRVRARRNK